MIRIFLCVLGFAICQCCLIADVTAQAIARHTDSELAKDLQSRQDWRLMLTPMPEGKPALQRSLLPPYWEQQNGDATPYYFRALMQEAGLPDENFNRYRDRSEAWLANTLDAATRNEIRTWLAVYDKILEDLRVATYRERIDMDLRLRDLTGLDAIYFRLPSAQKARDLARMLQVKVRLEVAEQRYDDAIETLRMGYRLAQFAAKTPTLINDLVGVAISDMMTHELVRLVGSPDAPNMYWAVASLPRPLIDLREAFEHESQFPGQIFSFLKDAETAQRTPEQWQQLVINVFMSTDELTGDYADKPAPISPEKAEELMIKGYPRAKQNLINDGLDQATIDSMSVGQVLAIHAARRTRRLYEENYKWFMLSYAEARKHWSLSPTESDDPLGIRSEENEVLPIGSILMPNFRLAWHAPMRCERQFAAVRTIEAIRMHAAANGGALPASLADVRVVVVPNDPFFDEPFTYQVNGETAVLTTRSAGTEEPRHEIYRYELTVKE